MEKMKKIVQQVFAEPKKAWASFVSSVVGWLAIVGVFNADTGVLNVEALSSLTFAEIAGGIVLLLGNGAVYFVRNRTPSSVTETE